MPNASGLCSAGVQKQLSTTLSAPISRPSAASASRSTSSISGFEGVSANSRRVRGRIAALHAAGSEPRTNVASMPKRSRLPNNWIVAPNTLALQMT
jgi:hypothetical protein